MFKRSVAQILSIALAVALIPALARAATPKSEAPVERPYGGGGMWMPRQIADIHGDTLKKMGLEIDPAALANPLEFPLNAIVSLGGGSASFVSEEGLALTNHHCVRGPLQFNSTAERNLLENGYLARSREEELPGGPTARIYVTTAITDVTSRVLEGALEMKDDLERYNLIEKRQKEIIKEAEKAAPHTRCSVAKFYGGGKYYLIERLEIKDVRLVYAPHAGIGYFGGDEDNWMWPRHCGDFAALRAYVAPNGEPAEYAKENVPFKPKAFLNVAAKGPAEGDLTFVVGYPGRTQRQATALETAGWIEWEYGRRVDLMQRHIDLLHEITDGDKALEIKAATSIFGMENSKKKLMGVLDCAAKTDIVGMKKADEKELGAWIGTNADRRAKYGNIIERINSMVLDHEKTREKDMAFNNISRASALLGAANTIARMAEERPKPDLEREPGYQERDWQQLGQSQERMEKTYAREIDKSVLEMYLKEAAGLKKEDRPEILAEMFGDKPIDEKAIREKVLALLDGTHLADLDTRLKLLRGASSEELKASNDTMIQLALKLRPYLRALEEQGKRRSGAMLLVRPTYHEALSEMKEGKIAPDANSTIRVSFGTVRGFKPAPDRPMYHPFTNVWQMAEKWAHFKGVFPYNAPANIIETVARGRFGPYETAAGEGVPVNFLTDLDITGGNSGSATLNARGEFIGIVFDGNIEGLGGDLIFRDETKRAIHVDARYLKWTLDAVEGAGHLLREMRVEPVFAK